MYLALPLGLYQSGGAGAVVWLLRRIPGARGGCRGTTRGHRRAVGAPAGAVRSAEWSAGDLRWWHPQHRRSRARARAGWRQGMCRVE